MTRFVPINVQAYAGSKADEAPRAFSWNGRVFALEEIVDRWYQAARDPTQPSADYFKVRTAASSSSGGTTSPFSGRFR